VIDRYNESGPPRDLFGTFLLSLRDSRLRVSPQVFLAALSLDTAGLPVASAHPSWSKEPVEFSVVQRAAADAGCLALYLGLTSEDFTRFLIVEREGHEAALRLFAERGPYVERSLSLWWSGAGWAVRAGRRRVCSPGTVLALRQALRRAGF